MRDFKVLTEKMLRREDKFQGKIVSVHVDEVLLPNGHTSIREVVDHVDGVTVLPLDEENRVLTVTQYRYVFGKNLLELPAGKLDPGEDPVTGALRELKEETGAVPEEFVSLGRIIPAPGKTVGDSVSFGGLLGTAPVMNVHGESSAVFINRGGRIPAPLHSVRN